jgi:hypothetical protein
MTEQSDIHNYSLFIVNTGLPGQGGYYVEDITSRWIWIKSSN